MRSSGPLAGLRGTRMKDGRKEVIKEKGRGEREERERKPGGIMTTPHCEIPPTHKRPAHEVNIGEETHT